LVQEADFEMNTEEIEGMDFEPPPDHVRGKLHTRKTPAFVILLRVKLLRNQLPSSLRFDETSWLGRRKDTK